MFWIISSHIKLLARSTKTLARTIINSIGVVVYCFDKTYCMFWMVLHDYKSCNTTMTHQWLTISASTRLSSQFLENIGGHDFVIFILIMFIVVIHVADQKTFDITHMDYYNNAYS